MKEVWVKIKGFKKYSISNKGKVRNDKSKYITRGWQLKPNSNLLYIHLVKVTGEQGQIKAVHTLVAKHFKKMKSKDTTAIHLNYVQYDNREPNVEGSTRGQAIVRTRKFNSEKRNKLKGIHKHPHGLKFPNMTWRAMLCTGNMKVKTLGYFRTRKEAIKVYYQAYKELNGVKPFNLNKYV